MTKPTERRNLNVSLPASLYRKLRLAAAAEDRSLSSYVVALLSSRVGGEPAGNPALSSLLEMARSVRAAQKPGRPAPRPTKEELHGADE
jgi:hypothetical protein